MITVRPLQDTDIDQMHQCFTEAFQGYFVPMQLSKAQFRHRFCDKLAINLALSAGAFDGNVLVGFIFTSTGLYNGVVTAYNAGTGVLPTHRGRGITVHMYNKLQQWCTARGIRQCLLEVITANKGAIRSYERCGLHMVEKYRCFQLPVDRPLVANGAHPVVRIHRATKAHWPQYEAFWQATPSFSSTPQVIDREGTAMYIAEAYLANALVGYIIFDPKTGRIEQLAVAPALNRQGIGSALLQYADQQTSVAGMSVLNVPESTPEMVAFFQSRGFINHLNQYLMVCRLA